MKVKLILFLLLTLVLGACGRFDNATPQALPTIVLDEGALPAATSAATSSGGVVASGVVVPSQKAQLVFSLGGKIKSVAVSVGESVQTGQPLVELEGQEDLQVALSTARYELDQAQQGLADLNAQAETQRIQAMKDIITFEKAVRDAQYVLDNFIVPSNQANLDTVEALNQMKQRLDEARVAFEPYKLKPENDSTRQDLKKALDEAQADYNAAVKRLQYEYDLEVVQRQLSQALKDYEKLKAGPDPDQVKLAEARQAKAQDQVAAAEAALNRLTLTAPFVGTVSEVKIHAGEWVIPGQLILVLADLSNLRVETTDLSERDVPRVEAGQKVQVFIKALNQSVTGQVSQVSPVASTLGGDVVYATTIVLDEQPEGLREGMTVEVEFSSTR